MKRLQAEDRAIVTEACGGSERLAAGLLAVFGGATPTRLTAADKAHIRRLIAVYDGADDPDAGYTGKGIRHDFHLVDVAARYLRLRKAAGS